MPIKAICGSTYSLVRKSVVAILKDNLSLDKVNYIICPDNMVNFVKCQIMIELGESCAFNFKVMSLLSLAKEFLPLDKKLITASQGEMILKSIAIQNASKLKSFGKIVCNNGAITEILSMIDKLASSNINPIKLLECGKSIGGILGAKVLDIAFLYEEYYKAIADIYLDKHIIYNNFSITDLSGVLPENANFYVVDFSIMTAEELRMLNAISKACQSLVIGVVCNENSDNKRIYPRFLIDFCKNLSVNGFALEFIQADKTSELIRDLLVNNLYGYNQSEKAICDGSIEVKHADNILLEVKGVCREIRKAVVEQGYRYKDITILCPDIEGYKSDIIRQFEIFELPYYLKNSYKLVDFAICKLLLKGFEILKSGFDKSAMLDLSKNQLLDFCNDDINKFELYVNKYNIDGEQFLTNFECSSDSLFEKANEIRAKLVQLVGVLGECESGCGSFAIECVTNYLNKIIGGNSYYIYLNKLQAVGGENARHMSELAYSKVLSIIESVQEVACVITNLDVYGALQNVLTVSKVCGGKQQMDSINIISDKKQVGNPKLLVVMGANDSVIVRESSSIGLFTYNELELLASNGIEFTPNIMDINYNEKFEAVQLFANGEKVLITYNQAVGDCSIVVKNVCNILNIKSEQLVGDSNTINMNYSNYAMKIGTKSNAKQELANYFGERMRGIDIGDRNVFDYLYTKLDGQFKYENIIKEKDFKYVKPNDLCWGKTEDKLFASVSAVERYLDCPFKFYCERMLGLKKNQNGGLDIATMGSFVHRILEKFFRRHKDLSLPENEIKKIANDLCRETILEESFKAVGKSYSKNTLENSLFKRAEYVVYKAVAVASRSDFEIEKTELTFGFEYSDIPAYSIEVGNNQYYVRGKIDRVDKFGDYVAIIDYKSKSKISCSAKEVYYGERVQLLIYLNAYMHQSKVTPFALLYLPMPYSYAKGEDSAVYKYSGFVRDLDNAISHFDNKYQDERLCSLPLKFYKGELTDKNRLKKQELDILCEYADKVVAQAISEIESGYIEAKPESCDGCEYGQICLRQNDPQNARKKGGKQIVITRNEEKQNGETEV